MAKETNDQKVIYSMLKVSKVYPPNRYALKEITLGFYYGAKIGVLGLNGSGKSTLLHIMAGVDRDFLGETTLSKGYTVGLLEQEPKLDASKTVKEIVEEAVSSVLALMKRFEEINAAFTDSNADIDALVEEQAKVQEELDRHDAWNLESRLELAMDALRCPPPNMAVANLSGGEKRRVALCRLLLIESDILLLDEPTNHLDAESVAWLEHHLQQYKGTVIAVTHDRYFLDNVAQWILELDRGHGIPWKGNYSSWLEQKQQRLAQEEKAESKRQKTLQRELEWIRMAPKARQAKGKARINAYENLLSQEYEKAREDREIYIPPGPRLGDVVINFHNVSKGYGDYKLFDNFSFNIPPGSMVGVIGPNGAGKSTLLKLIAGIETPDSGSIEIGSTVKLAYVEQIRDSLNGEKTVWEEISGGAEFFQFGNYKVNSRGYVAGFNFLGTDQQKKVKDLSGGERNRVQLAKMLTSGANVLLLDEPTNDLDVNTIRALEEALESFAGCAVIVSHDRWFLDRVATHILAFEDNGHIEWFYGNFSEYEANRRKMLGSAADHPHRMRYRGLTR